MVVGESRLRVRKELVKFLGEDPCVITMVDYGGIRSIVSAYALLEFMGERNAGAYDDFERVLATVESGEPDFSRLEKYPGPIASILASHLAGPTAGILELTEEDVDALKEDVRSYARTFPHLPSEITDLFPKLEDRVRERSRGPVREARRNAFQLL